MDPRYPQVDEAERLIQKRATAQRELREARALIPAYQTVIENAAKTTINALQAGLLPNAIIEQLREALSFAYEENIDGH